VTSRARSYSFTDIVALSVVTRLLGTGVALANVRTALATLHTHHGSDLAGLTLLTKLYLALVQGHRAGRGGMGRAVGWAMAGLAGRA
jgi:DNA-binding transcriptional MerR regulator